MLNLSGTDLRDRLNEGREIPSWFTYPEVVRELRRSFPPRHKQGVTIFFTGLSGSGKSTIANVLLTKFLETGGRPVTILDGDLVRKHLRPSLGSQRSIATSTSGALDMSPPRSPRTAGSRSALRSRLMMRPARMCAQMIEPFGGFILVHVSTPVDICEQRDRKGLYAKARAGILKEFTGISDPYEVPADAEVGSIPLNCAGRGGAGDHSAPRTRRFHRRQS